MADTSTYSQASPTTRRSDADLLAQQLGAAHQQLEQAAAETAAARQNLERSFSQIEAAQRERSAVRAQLDALQADESGGGSVLSRFKRKANSSSDETAALTERLAQADREVAQLEDESDRLEAVHAACADDVADCRELVAALETQVEVMASEAEGYDQAEEGGYEALERLSADVGAGETPQEKARHAIANDPVFGELQRMVSDGEPAAAPAPEPAPAPAESAAQRLTLVASATEPAATTKLDTAISPAISEDGFAYEGVEEQSVDGSEDEDEDFSTSVQKLRAGEQAAEPAPQPAPAPANLSRWGIPVEDEERMLSTKDNNDNINNNVNSSKNAGAAPAPSRSLFSKERKSASPTAPAPEPEPEPAISDANLIKEPPRDPKQQNEQEQQQEEEDPLKLAQALMDEIASSDASLTATQAAPLSDSAARERYTTLSARIFRGQATADETDEAARLAERLEEGEGLKRQREAEAEAMAEAAKRQHEEARQLQREANRVAKQQQQQQEERLPVGEGTDLGDGRIILRFTARGQFGIKFGKDGAGHCIVKSLTPGGLAQTLCRTHGLALIGGERLASVGETKVLSLPSDQATERLKAAAGSRPLSLTFQSPETVAKHEPERRVSSVASSPSAHQRSASSAPRPSAANPPASVAASVAEDQRQLEEIEILQALLAKKTQENDDLRKEQRAVVRKAERADADASMLREAQKVATELQDHLATLDGENAGLRERLHRVEQQAAANLQPDGEAESTPKKKAGKKAGKRFDPSEHERKKQMKQDALEKRKAEAEEDMAKELAERSLHKATPKLGRSQRESSARKLSQWTKRTAPGESKETSDNVTASFEKFLSERAPSVFAERSKGSDGTEKSPPKKRRSTDQILEAELSGLPEQVSAEVLERLHEEKLLRHEVRRLKRERHEWEAEVHLRRAWEEHYVALVDQLSLLASDELRGEVSADHNFLDKARSGLADEQVAAIDTIRKEAKARRDRLAHYKKELSTVLKTKEANETILHEMVVDPNLSLGDPGTSPSQSHNVESLQSQIAHLKRQLKSREQRYRTATIVSAEAAEELNLMREKVEAAGLAASESRKQVRNTRQQYRDQFEKTQRATEQAQRTADTLNAKLNEISKLKTKVSRLEDQVESMGHDNPKFQRPRFMQRKKKDDEILERLREDLHNANSRAQVLERQLERRDLNIKRLEDELDGTGENRGSFSALSSPAPLASPSSTFGRGGAGGSRRASNESRRVSWHADDVEETLEYEKGSEPGSLFASRGRATPDRGFAEDESGWADREASAAAHMQRGALSLSHSERVGREVGNIFRSIASALKAHRTLYGIEITEARDLFELIDSDGSHTLDYAEFREALHRLDIGLTDAQVSEVLGAVDADRSGTIEYGEFVAQLEAVWYHDEGMVLEDVETSGREEEEEEEEEERAAAAAAAAERKRQMAAKFAAMAQEEEEEQQQQPEGEDGGDEEGEDLLAQATALMNSMGGSSEPEDGERLRRYRERETERHLSRVDQMWEGCVVLKHSTSRGTPTRLSPSGRKLSLV